MLLRHDAPLPSATALLAGAPIVGSWWGHPFGNQLYDWLSEFEHGAGALSLKPLPTGSTWGRPWSARAALAEAAACFGASASSKRGLTVAFLDAPAKLTRRR